MKLRFSILIIVVLFITVLPASAQLRSGDLITIEGEVTEILSPYAFVMLRTAPFDFTPSQVIVFNDDTLPFIVDVNLGNTVQVTGRVNSFALDDIMDDVGYEIDASLFNEYIPTDFALIASSVVDVLMVPPLPDFTYDPDFVSIIEADPSAYIEQSITVEGYVAEIIDPFTFRLAQTKPFDLSPSYLLVFNDDIDPYEVDINMGRHVRVTGTFYVFDVERMDERLGYYVDPELFVRFDNQDYAIIEDSVVATGIRTPEPPIDTGNGVDIDPATATFVEMDDIEANPFDFVGRTVRFDGEIETIYTERSLLIEEEEFFDLFPLQIPVFTTQDVVYPVGVLNSADLEIDKIYTVIGEIVLFDLADIETRLGYTLDAETYSDFDGTNIALIAVEIMDESD